jgi:hypothetical protein
MWVSSLVLSLLMLVMPGGFAGLLRLGSSMLRTSGTQKKRRKRRF